MKKLFLILVSVFVFIVITNAQVVRSVVDDTIKAAETVNFGAIRSSTSAGMLTISATCTELGGTSDGTLILQGGTTATDYITIVETTGVFNFYPNDTLTITDGAIIHVVINDSPFKYYRWQGAGTSADTTIVSPTYMKK